MLKIFIMMIILVINRFVRSILSKLKLSYYQVKWRKINPHNYTVMNSFVDFNKVIVGKKSYGPLIVLAWGVENELLQIGNFCSIASGVKFILGGNHNLDSISTYPFKSYYENKEEALSKGPIIIEDDVWIGTDCILLSGITIGQGSVIAAGSVVTKSHPPYCIIGGNPAKVIKRRFSDDECELLIKNIDYSKLEEEELKKNTDLYTKDIENFKKELLKQNNR